VCLTGVFSYVTFKRGIFILIWALKVSLSAVVGFEQSGDEDQMLDLIKSVPLL